jgi:hypothetical protein
MLAALAVFYLALLVSEPTSTTTEPPIIGVRMPLRVLFALGPLAIWLTILAAYGTMRMVMYGELRLKVLDRYVPSSFMDSPNFLDAVVFTPPLPWGRRIERSIARFAYPTAVTIPWLEAFALLYLGYKRGFFSVSPYVVAAAYLPPMLWSLRCVVRLWSDRIFGKRARGATVARMAVQSRSSQHETTG